jgi:hypothetical protein
LLRERRLLSFTLAAMDSSCKLYRSAHTLRVGYVHATGDVTKGEAES